MADLNELADELLRELRPIVVAWVREQFAAPVSERPTAIPRETPLATVNVKEAMAQLQRSERSVLNICREGMGHRVGGQWRIDQWRIDAYLGGDRETALRR